MICAGVGVAGIISVSGSSRVNASTLWTGFRRDLLHETIVVYCVTYLRWGENAELAEDNLTGLITLEQYLKRAEWLALVPQLVY